MKAETIKDFLIFLGFKVEEADSAEWQSMIIRATQNIIRLGIAAEAVMLKVADFSSKITHGGMPDVASIFIGTGPRFSHLPQGNINSPRSAGMAGSFENVPQQTSDHDPKIKEAISKGINGLFWQVEGIRRVTVPLTQVLTRWYDDDKMKTEGGETRPDRSQQKARRAKANAAITESSGHSHLLPGAGAQRLFQFLLANGGDLSKTLTSYHSVLGNVQRQSIMLPSTETRNANPKVKGNVPQGTSIHQETTINIHGVTAPQHAGKTVVEKQMDVNARLTQLATTGPR